MLSLGNAEFEVLRRCSHWRNQVDILIAHLKLSLRKDVLFCYKLLLSYMEAEVWI